MEKINLLLVEDDQDFSNALMSRLIKRDFSVTVVDSAETALDKLNNILFDVIIADIKLPGMDGMKFLANVRETNRDLPVIIITGYANLESVKDAVTLKATDYLLKPLETIDDLLNPIYKAVNYYKLLIQNKNLFNELKIKIKELEESEKKLQEQNLILEQKNSALKEILGQIEIEKKRIKNDIYTNIDKLVFPTLKKLRIKTSSSSAKYLDIIEHNLESLTSSLGYKITENKIKLTQREIEICNVINQGLSNKEISKLLNISVHTIESHRNKIRKKFGIINQNINLTTYLKY